MNEDKARIRAKIRACRRARRAKVGAGGSLPSAQAGVSLDPDQACAPLDSDQAGDAAGTVEAEGLLSSWHEALAGLGVLPDALPALFIPTPREPDVRGIIDACPRSILPVLVDEDGPLPSPAWAGHEAGADLVHPDPKRPAQPASPVLPAGALAEAGVLLIAGLAVDGSGNRLGQGGGWYDRALRERSPDAPIIVALFDEEFLADGELPHEAHDVRVDAVITPTRAILLRP